MLIHRYRFPLSAWGLVATMCLQPLLASAEETVKPIPAKPAEKKTTAKKPHKTITKKTQPPTHPVSVADTKTGSTTIQPTPPVAQQPPALATPAQPTVPPIPIYVWVPRPNPYLPNPNSAALPIMPPGVMVGSPFTGWKPMIPVTMVPVAVPAESELTTNSAENRSFLPTFKKVYPTGEKPMVIITFHCPTELAGIATPSTKILHGVVDLGMGGINATNLLPFTLQQVCQ